MKLDTPGTAPKKWMDGNQVVFQAWREGAPWKNETYLCATMQSSKQEDPEKYGTWVNNHCTEWTKLPVCKRPALSGPITPPPDVPDIPPSIECDAGWKWDQNRNLCYYFDPHERGWDAAEANCKGLGGTMVSINSPDQQMEIWKMTSFDPQAIGKNEGENLTVELLTYGSYSGSCWVRISP